MPSETDAESRSRSIRRWLQVIAFTLGIGLVTLADIGYVVTGYQEDVLFTVTGVAGGLVALAAAVTLVVDLLPESSAPDPDDTTRVGSDDTRHPE
ncbi:hypothetical protein [Haloarcula brevis]|uniref:hypothetical protein n=1 Tax=Haloarcula brevis TaxID=3111453 RepID=UPI00300EBA0E